MRDDNGTLIVKDGVYPSRIFNDALIVVIDNHTRFSLYKQDGYYFGRASFYFGCLKVDEI